EQFVIHALETARFFRLYSAQSFHHRELRCEHLLKAMGLCFEVRESLSGDALLISVPRNHEAVQPLLGGNRRQIGQRQRIFRLKIYSSHHHPRTAALHRSAPSQHPGSANAWRTRSLYSVSRPPESSIQNRDGESDSAALRPHSSRYVSRSPDPARDTAKRLKT